MIELMTKYSFILLSENQEKFLEELQELGVVDITRSVKPVDSDSEAMLQRAERIKRTISLLSPFAGGTEVYKLGESIDDTMNRTASLLAKRDELSSQIEVLKKGKALRQPWGVFDSSKVKGLEAHGLYVKYYKVASKSLSEETLNSNPVSVIHNDGQNAWIVSVSEDSAYKFSETQVEAPSGCYLETEAKINQAENELKSSEIELASLSSIIPLMEAELVKISSSLDLYLAGVASTKAADSYISVLEGFAPCGNDESLKASFDSMDIYWTSSKAVADDKPPIELKNNKFVALFKPLTDMYGRPNYDEFDPTPFLSIFFMLFFAFCMGDMGYGLILILLGFLLKKAKGLASFAPLVTVLGGATVVIGFLFHTFFSVDIMTWSIIPDAVKKIMLPSEIAGFDGTMVLSIIVGVVHVCLALVTKAIVATKNNGFVNNLGTWGWTLLLVGGSILGGFTLAGVLDSDITKWVAIGLGAVSAVGIFLLNDIHRNPLLNIGSGLWETYNTATGILGDVLSYLRLYALGLAGSMLGRAFNDLGMMVLGDGSGFSVNWIFFALVVLIGHTLNIAMAALGAFVHPLRLNFLEFFKNSGYSGTGRTFNPLRK